MPVSPMRCSGPTPPPCPDDGEVPTIKIHCFRCGWPMYVLTYEEGDPDGNCEEAVLHCMKCGNPFELTPGFAVEIRRLVTVDMLRGHLESNFAS